METLRTETVHVTGSIHSTLTCVNVQDVKETSTENEEEKLLYGADEDDALSDDSLRLRVSDDEDIEAEDAVTSIKSIKGDNKPKNNMAGMVRANSGPDTTSEKEVTELKEPIFKNDTSVNEIAEKESRKSGDNPLNETNKSKSPRNQNVNESKLRRSPLSRQFSVPRPKGHDNRRKFLAMNRSQQYRPESCVPYMRPHFYSQNGIYRGSQENYWNNPLNYNGFRGSYFSYKYGRYSGTGHDAWSNHSAKRIKEGNKKGSPKDSSTSSANITQSKAKDGEHAEQQKIKDEKAVIEANETSNVDNNKDDTEDQADTKNDVHEDKENSTVSIPSEIVKETDECSENHNKEGNKDSSKECTLTCENNDEMPVTLQEEQIKDNNEEDKIKSVGKLVKLSVEILHNNVECTITNDDAERKNNAEETIETDTTKLSEISNKKEKAKENIEKEVEQSENCSSVQEEQQKNDDDKETDKVKAQEEKEAIVCSTEISEENEAINVESEPEKEDNNTDNQISNVIEESALNEAEIKLDSANRNIPNVIENYSSLSNDGAYLESKLKKRLKIALLNKKNKSDTVKQKSSDVDDNITDNHTLTDGNLSLEKDNTLPVASDELKTNDDENKHVEELITPPRRRRRTKRISIATQDVTVRQETQELQNGRQKRRTAKNAAEIIRKRFLHPDSDLESSDDSDKFVMVNPKNPDNARSLSPPSLKRPCRENSVVTMNGSVKKTKTMADEVNGKTQPLLGNVEKMKSLFYARKFFQRDFKGRIPKLKPEELEELLIQMIAEVITNRSEMGKLREQARISFRNQETLRTRCQQLAKQIKDMEMVINRNAVDRRANNDKPTAPIKINRSVGLQVNIMSSEYGMQNLRQIQHNAGVKSMNVSQNLNTSGVETNSKNTPPKRGLKVRSPRKSDPAGASQITKQNEIPTSSLISTLTPTALVVTKPAESQHAITLSTTANNVQKALPVGQPQTVIINGKIPSPNNRQSMCKSTAKTVSNDLIDLTDEEEKSKSSTEKSVNISPTSTGPVKTQQPSTQTPPQPCYQRVISAMPTNVTITNHSIRVVQPAVQPTPTALVNNMSAPRLAYVMQGNGPPRQLLITSNSNSIRPTAPCRPPVTTVTYKTGIQSIANGSVRLLTTPATANIQQNKHPAPLPDISKSISSNPAWKLPPPAPSLKISKHSNGTQKGIVLSWNMTLTDKHAEIVSYQLYAYQEIPGMQPSTSLWKKVGDVRALPLPMACTLTQFSESNNYYFAVRAVDAYSRKGQYSVPGNISL